MTSKCCKTLAVFLLFCWIGIPQGLADIVAVSVSQQVSVSGFVTACDAGCEMLYGISSPGQSFSLANANTTLPTTNIFQNGSANDTVTLPFFDREASVDASASQTSALNAANLNFYLSESGDLSGSAPLMSGTVSANSQYSLVFNLTNPYVVHLTGFIDGGSDVGEIHLTGPGLQFDQYAGDTFDEILTLGPGQYTLDAVSGFNVQGYYFLDSSPFSYESLNADFTPAVPEPAQVATVLGGMMAMGFFLTRRRGHNRLKV